MSKPHLGSGSSGTHIRELGIEQSISDSSELLIQLSQSAEENNRKRWTVDFVRLKSKTIENAIRYRGNCSMHTAFPSEFVDFVQKYLNEQTEDKGMLSAPNAFVSLSNLVMGGMRLVIYRLSNNIRRATIRFKRVIGSLSCLIQSQDVHDSHETLRNDMALSTVLDLVSPCLHLAEFGDATDSRNTEGLQNTLERLRRNREELAFFEFLIKRYLSRKPNGLKPAFGAAEPANSVCAMPAIKHSICQV